MKLAYRAYETNGREVRDVIEAPSVAEAADRLRQKSMFVAEINPAEANEAAGVAGAAGRRGGFRLPFGKTRRLKQLAMFTRQLFVLIRSGTPLAEGLDSLSRQTKNADWREVIEDVRKHLEQGSSLSKAMETRPETFDAVYRNMISAGEHGGKLGEVLDRLAKLTRKQLQVRRTIVGAMIYPALLVNVCIGTFIVMLLFVVPRFGDLFKTLAVPLPPTTAMLLTLSGLLRSYWWAFGGGLVAAVTGIVLFCRSEAGIRAKDTLVLRLPIVGKVTRGFATARIARLLGILMNSHLPVLECLRLTRGAVGNIHYVRLLARAEEAVSRGEPISSAFKDTDLISSSAYEATRSGEQSGQVSALLLDLAEFLDEENEIGLKGLISLLEPTILIFMGVLVAFVALSIFTPLFDATSLAGGGG
jgi:type II secretory pathway component PulF